ncbi:hypothetical protein QQF64_006640 [Cirrhinus molitorella]|uniref:Endonuclease/exonuclease/phosphatase domain-containing protein n=1 Tax=Cirrhinus molitorella TaxID=172907 RepID=A0ABR3M975_9TELE
MLDYLDLAHNDLVVICGDFNEDLLHIGKKPILEMFEARGYTQLCYTIRNRGPLNLLNDDSGGSDSLSHRVGSYGCVLVLGHMEPGPFYGAEIPGQKSSAHSSRKTKTGVDWQLQGGHWQQRQTGYKLQEEFGHHSSPVQGWM